MENMRKKPTKKFEICPKFFQLASEKFITNLNQRISFKNGSNFWPVGSNECHSDQHCNDRWSVVVSNDQLHWSKLICFNKLYNSFNRLKWMQNTVELI